MLYQTAHRLLFLAIILFNACTPAATYFSLTGDGNYDWTSSPSVENEEQFLAYQHEGTFMLAKNSVQNGLQPLKKVIAIGQTEFTNASGKTVACLAYKEGKNYDGPWEVIKYTGEKVASDVYSLPAKIIQQADGVLTFVR